MKLLTYKGAKRMAWDLTNSNKNDILLNDERKTGFLLSKTRTQSRLEKLNCFSLIAEMRPFLLETNMYMAKCIVCDKEFRIAKWRIGKAKFCSYVCYNKHRTTKKSYHNKRVCKGCGKKFYPTQWYQKYCNRKCFIETIRNKKTIICPTCNKKFVKIRWEQKYCSRKCGEPYMRTKFKKIKKNYLDKLWSILVRINAFYKCEYCGNTKFLNSHHIYSRTNFNIRWDVNNGICLCAKHHLLGNFSAHKSPLEFYEWLKEKRGANWWNNLIEKRKILKKYTLSEKQGLLNDFKQKIIVYEKENKITLPNWR